MANVQELVKKVDQLSAVMEKAMKPQAAPAGVLTQFKPSSYYHEWPEKKQLEAVAKAYNSEHAAQMLMKSGKTRALGIGPALVKMASLQFPQLNPGNSDYNIDQFEKEYGFTSVTKAASRGVRGPSGEFRKTALAENSGITGGYIVPPQFMTELLTIAAEDAFIEPRAKVVPMTSRTMSFPMTPPK
jgi:HK97 family phage major capsid protein